MTTKVLQFGEAPLTVGAKMRFHLLMNCQLVFHDILTKEERPVAFVAWVAFFLVVHASNVVHIGVLLPKSELAPFTDDDFLVDTVLPLVIEQLSFKLAGFAARRAFWGHIALLRWLLLFWLRRSVPLLRRILNQK